MLIDYIDVENPPATAKILARDAVISPGTLFAVDLARDWCWAGGDPAGNDQVRDLTWNNRNDIFVSGKTSGDNNGAATYAGGGFDFGASAGFALSAFCYIQIPASVLAALWGGSQYFLSALYVRLPSSANWPNSTSNSTNADRSLINWGAGNYTTGNTFHTFSMMNDGSIRATRKIPSSHTHTSLSGVKAAMADTITQLAIWRTAAGVGVRAKNASTIISNTNVVGLANDADFSALTGQIGLINDGATRIASTERNFRVYRYFLEDLEVSGRDPVTVLDEDWARTVARGVFS